LPTRPSRPACPPTGTRSRDPPCGSSPEVEAEREAVSSHTLDSKIDGLTANGSGRRDSKQNAVPSLGDAKPAAISPPKSALFGLMSAPTSCGHAVALGYVPRSVQRRLSGIGRIGVVAPSMSQSSTRLLKRPGERPRVAKPQPSEQGLPPRRKPGAKLSKIEAGRMAASASTKLPSECSTSGLECWPCPYLGFRNMGVSYF
jgi:hypothetical protein